MKIKMGDEFIGATSGLRLEVGDIDGDSYTLKCERRVVDRKTGEILTETRDRTVEKRHLARVLKGYKKV